MSAATPYGGHTPITSRGSEQGNRYSPTGYDVLTLSGALIDIRAPRPEQIKLSDIAVGLATDMRFAGQCPLRPTVAQHSLAVERITAKLHLDASPFTVAGALDASRAALMHDAAEAYLNDLTGAVKLRMRDDGFGGRDERSEFDEIEADFMLAIQHRFEFSFEGCSHVVHEADCIACAYEMAWGGWCAEAKPPEWVHDLVWDCYADLPGWGDGGRYDFTKRANTLGMR